MEPKPMGLSQESLSLWLLRKLQFRDISIYESLAIAFYEALLLILMNDLSKKSKKVEGLEKVIQILFKKYLTQLAWKCNVDVLMLNIYL